MHHIKDENGTLITDRVQIANTLGAAIEKSSSSKNYSKEFQSIKAQKEKQNINFKTNKNLRYNKKFTMRDLKRSLKKSNNSSPGPDQIHYEILRHLPIETLHILLDIINETWKSDTFPESWREALIISIPKQAIESQESKNPLVNRVLQTCQRILSGNKYITFCWLPSHRDIRGNENADRAAKDALAKAQPENFDIPCTDAFMKIQPFVSSLWQERWDKEVNNKLHAIMPQIDEKYYSGCTNRKDEVIINRLRIGHTRLTHSFRMENRPNPPLCDQCEGDHELTVKHILIECNFLKIIRRRHYDVTDLNQLFKTVSSKRILDFVKDIGLYNSL